MSAHSARPDDLIEAYVTDVIRRLPGRQRNDVGFELRALLREELRGRAADAGRPADETMTLDFLRAFGNPDDVAARYHPPGEPIIPAAHTRGFVWASVIGLVLQWLTTLPMAINANAAQDGAWIGRWWLSYGLGAFWWPGFLVTMLMASAFIRQRWPAVATVWKPKGVDRDHVNRPLLAVGLALALAGIGLWVALAWWATTNTDASPVAKAFAFDAGFLATRAPVVLLYWAVGIVLLSVVIVEGRWRALTRRLDTALKLICCVMLAWLAFGGRIFVADATNEPVRGILALLIIGLLAEAAWRLWRGRSRIHAPDGVATGA